MISDPSDGGRADRRQRRPVLDTPQGIVFQVGHQEAVVVQFHGQALRRIELGSQGVAIQQAPACLARGPGEGHDAVVGGAQQGVVGGEPDRVVEGIADEEADLVDPEQSTGRVEEGTGPEKGVIGACLPGRAQIGGQVAGRRTGQGNEFDRFIAGVGNPKQAGAGLVCAGISQSGWAMQAGPAEQEVSDPKQGVAQIQHPNHVVPPICNINIARAVLGQAVGIAKGRIGPAGVDGRAPLVWPASVVTVPSLKRTKRSKWLPLSVTSSPPTPPKPATNRPCGLLKWAA